MLRPADPGICCDCRQDEPAKRKHGSCGQRYPKHGSPSSANELPRFATQDRIVKMPGCVSGKRKETHPGHENRHTEHELELPEHSRFKQFCHDSNAECRSDDRHATQDE